MTCTGDNEKEGAKVTNKNLEIKEYRALEKEETKSKWPGKRKTRGKLVIKKCRNHLNINVQTLKNQEL